MSLHRLYSSACHPFSICQLKNVWVKKKIKKNVWVVTSVIVVHFFLDLHHKHKLYKLRNTIDTAIKEAEDKN